MDVENAIRAAATKGTRMCDVRSVDRTSIGWGVV
jgi:hypothetical protein